MIHIGLVGLGFIGRTHLEAYQQLHHAEVIQICTRSGLDKNLTYNGEVTADYEVLLNNPEIDVIDICVPTYLHEEYIMKAAEAGKDIICEKPLALNQEATKRIIKAVQDADVQLFVGHVLRFWPAYQKIKQICDDTNFPPVDIVEAKRLGQMPTWSKWFQDPEKSGGALYDLHIHDIDFAYYLLGEVETVYAVGKQNEYGAWNHLMTTLIFRSGAKAYIEASHRMPEAYPFTMAFRAQAKGSVIDFQLKAGENIEEVNDSQFDLYKEGKQERLTVEETDAFQNELAYFVECLQSGKENDVIPLKDVQYVIGLLEAIERSLVTGEIQELNKQ
jgi:predicted dehydrogenase